MNPFTLEIGDGFLKQESSDVLEPVLGAGRANTLVVFRRNLSLAMKRGGSCGEHAGYPTASIRECYSPNSLSHQHCKFLTQKNSRLHVGVCTSGRHPLSQYQSIHHRQAYVLGPPNEANSLCLSTQNPSLVLSVCFLDKYCSNPSSAFCYSG